MSAGQADQTSVDHPRAPRPVIVHSISVRLVASSRQPDLQDRKPVRPFQQLGQTIDCRIRGAVQEEDCRIARPRVQVSRTLAEGLDIGQMSIRPTDRVNRVMGDDQMLEPSEISWAWTSPCDLATESGTAQTSAMVTESEIVHRSAVAMSA